MMHLHVHTSLHFTTFRLFPEVFQLLNKRGEIVIRDLICYGWDQALCLVRLTAT